MIKIIEKNDDIQLQYLPSDIFTRWREFNSNTHQIVYFPNSDLECEAYYDNNFKPAFTFFQGDFKYLVELLSYSETDNINVYFTTIQDSQIHIPKDFRKQYIITHNDDFELKVFMDEFYYNDLPPHFSS